MSADARTHEFRFQFDGARKRISIETPAGAALKEVVTALDKAHSALKKEKDAYALDDVLDRACDRNGWTWRPANIDVTFMSFD